MGLIIENGIVKRKIRINHIGGGYGVHKGFEKWSDSKIINMYKGDDTIKNIVLRYYPLKDNKDILLVNTLYNNATVRKLRNSVSKDIERLNKMLKDGKELYMIVDEDVGVIEIKDSKGDTVYILKV